MGFRIGFGVDFHQLVKGRNLFIGGVNIPHHKGALGHSDADVLLHAICDALLGALALGDIGTHFPNSAEEFRDINSLILLERTMDLIRREGYSVVNVDSTVCLEAPKISSFIPDMQIKIAEVTGLTAKQVSVKATTTEKMGFIGKGKGLMAYASVLLQEN